MPRGPFSRRIGTLPSLCVSGDHLCTLVQVLSDDGHLRPSQVMRSQWLYVLTLTQTWAQSLFLAALRLNRTPDSGHLSWDCVNLWEYARLYTRDYHLSAEPARLSASLFSQAVDHYLSAGH